MSGKTTTTKEWHLMREGIVSGSEPPNGWRAPKGGGHLTKRNDKIVSVNIVLLSKEQI